MPHGPSVLSVDNAMIAAQEPRSRGSVSDETIPLGVFLVKSDSSEEKLLFRFPYIIEEPLPPNQRKQNKYALIAPNKQESSLPTAGIPNNDQANTGLSALLPSFSELTSSITLDANDQDEITKVIGITDSAFSNLFGVLSHKLCGQKFELKVDNVRFVGHPTLLDNGQCFHVVFALKANAPHDVVKCYHEISQLIAIALKSEEKRCTYFTEQTKIMINCHDEVLAAQGPRTAGSRVAYQCPSPYKIILDRSKLAKNLQRIFTQLLNEGVVHIRVNGWVNVNFCLPQKVHRKLVPLQNAPPITPANIQECLKRLRPYHTFLLLVEISALIDSLPHDVSPPFVRLIRVANPLKNLVELSADADITLSQAFNIVAQLIYWGKATVIFPLCETNVYMLHPSAPTDIDSPLVREFANRFPDEHLLRTLSRFSLGVSLSQLRNPMDTPEQHNRLVLMIIWMLRKRLLMQFHTYVLFIPLLHGSPFLMQRLSFTQSNPSQERPPSSSTDLNDCSTMASSYQSESSFGISPAMTHFAEYAMQSQSGIRSDLDLNKVEVDQLSLKESAELILGELNLGPEEINAILATPSANNIDDIRLFAKLCPYFDGHHHIEDIMHYENLRRSQILTLVDKFRQVLVIFHYEDTTVDKLQPYNIL